ncbi:MAG: AmmeMemoRadiSam system protein A [Holophagae bacterium]|jgi:AmmeMemoRadiSam system protein A
MNGPDADELNGDEQRWLLDLARSTIAARLSDRPLPDAQPAPGRLTDARGAFVTLTRDGQLRGCIGHVTGTEALWRSVRSNAVNAAFHDPRFPPVEAGELSAISVEISVLTPLVTIAGPDEIVIGRDGLIIERRAKRGLLLPQVATRYGWSPAEFLDQTCRKAGLAAGCWRSPDARIARFAAQVFAEPDRT